MARVRRRSPCQSRKHRSPHALDRILPADSFHTYRRQPPCPQSRVLRANPQGRNRVCLYMTGNLMRNLLYLFQHLHHPTLVHYRQRHPYGSSEGG